MHTHDDLLHWKPNAAAQSDKIGNCRTTFAFMVLNQPTLYNLRLVARISLLLFLTANKRRLSTNHQNRNALSLFRGLTGTLCSQTKVHCLGFDTNLSFPRFLETVCLSHGALHYPAWRKPISFEALARKPL